ncbi:PREDICTED: COX assembly mitochondrial protein homolog, partial [Acanthisitta chloris]|uniref:COX assembly mitochondrial protein homolog n=1 Tax=Acanthisitta chloris TaxID=57068 RepID=UPI0004F0EABC
SSVLVIQYCRIAGTGAPKQNVRKQIQSVKKVKIEFEVMIEWPRWSQTAYPDDQEECVDDVDGAKDNSKLRHVEKDVLIPQIMRDRAKELCSDKVQAFTKCCQETGFLMVVKCRPENTALKDCLVGYYSDPSFYEECKTEYLKQREEYRATGIKKKRQKVTSNV